MLAGELPPPALMALDAVGMSAEPGRVGVCADSTGVPLQPLGTVHGGIPATLLDTAAGCAVHSTLPAGRGYTNLDLSTRFLRPVTVATGPVRCEGTVLSQGRTTALVQATLSDPAGRLLAHATSTCLLFDAPPTPQS